MPVEFAAAKLKPDAHTLLIVLSVLAIAPLAALLGHATESALSHVTESVSAKTGDAAGGLLSAMPGNLTELVIALTALRAAEHRAALGCDLGVPERSSVRNGEEALLSAVGPSAPVELGGRDQPGKRLLQRICGNA